MRCSLSGSRCIALRCCRQVVPDLGCNPRYSFWILSFSSTSPAYFYSLNLSASGSGLCILAMWTAADAHYPQCPLKPVWSKPQPALLTIHTDNLHVSAVSRWYSMDRQDRRHPSSSVAVADRSSIRHRSGTFSPNLRSKIRRDSVAAHNDGSSHPKIQVEDSDGRPTILLVNKAGHNADPVSQLASPTLPFHNGTVSHVKTTLALAREAEYAAMAAREECTEVVAEVEEREHVPVYAPFSPIPLTPQPPPPQRQAHPRQPADELGFLPDRQGVVYHAVPKTPPVPPRSPPAAAGQQSLPSRLLSWRKPPPKRLDSESSSTSASSSSTACYKDHASDVSEACAAGPNVVRRYKRPLLFDADSTQTLGTNSVLSTHSKLTKKFPISASVRKLSALGRGKVGSRDLAIVLLDEAEGLGMERVDRWTGHKWFLFLSVCTTFAYGASALAYATLTWFKSKSYNRILGHKPSHRSC